MSEESKGPLGDFVKNVKAGFNQMKTAPGKPKQPQAEPTIDSDLIDTDQLHTPQPGKNDLADDLLDEQGQEDSATPAQKPGGGMKNLSTKKKVLLGAVVLIAVVLFKNAAVPPVAVPTTPNADHVEKPKEKAAEIALDFGKPDPSKDEFPTASQLPSPLGDAPAADEAVGKQLDELDLNGPFQANENKATPAAVKTDAAPAQLDAFGFPAGPSKAPTDHQVNTDPGSDKPALTGQPATELFAPNVAPGTLATAENKDDANPFGVQKAGVVDTTDATLTAPTMLGKPAPVLAGTPLQNPDSGTQPRLQDNSKAEMADLGAQLKAKDEKILSLEKQLQLAKLETPSKVQSKPVKAKAPAPAKHSTAIAPRTAPKANLVATSSPRPKVCVKAVAPAARNCSTCVAHAFIVDSGVENMVGQGDYIQGFRVSITGDRLDLQNSAGQVMHKFWSQPNGGCTAL